MFLPRIYVMFWVRNGVLSIKMQLDQYILSGESFIFQFSLRDPFAIWDFFSWFRLTALPDTSWFPNLIPYSRAWFRVSGTCWPSAPRSRFTAALVPDVVSLAPPPRGRSPSRGPVGPTSAPPAKLPRSRPHRRGAFSWVGRLTRPRPILAMLPCSLCVWASSSTSERRCHPPWSRSSLCLVKSLFAQKM